tara:strand:+ start:93 stop:317 length:225 start_codon:yes stop_codon:yes gene_type:complete
MKKEYYLPLAIIIGAIIIGVSIYLGTTAEYRAKKAVCEEFWKTFSKKKSKATKEEIYLKNTQVMRCITKVYGPE